MQKIKNDNNRMQGILYIIVAGLFFSLMTLLVKMSGNVPTMQKAFFRNAVAAVVSIAILLRSDRGLAIQRKSIPSLLMRCICGTTGLIANFYAIDHLGLADANMLNKLSPFFAIVASLFILRERASKVDWMCVIWAFLGALLVIKPSFHMEAFYGLIGALGGLGAGVAYVFVRKLGGMGERGPVIVMCFSVFSSLLVLPFMVANYYPMTVKQTLILLLAGVCATGGQLCITKAYTKAPAKEISVFDYSQILFAAMWGFVFLGELPDRISLLGYVMIIAAGIWKWYYNLKKG